MRKTTIGKVLFFGLILIISSFLTGCFDSGKVIVENQPLSKTISVTDTLGRQVEIPAKVNRIGCLYAFSGHVTAMLGKGSNIVAVVDGLKRDKLLTELVPTVKDAVVPRAGGAINIEELIRVNPDVVFVQAETANDPGEANKLAKAGIPYLVVTFQSMEEQQYAIEMIGKAVGAEEKARAYLDFYRDTINLAAEMVKDIPQSQRVRLYHSVNEATRTDARDTLPADWIQTVGVINVSVDADLKLDGDKYFVSLEQIYLWDPEVIMANESGVADYIMTNKQWAGLQAVKNRRVYQMPTGISRWGHPGSLETPLAILWTAKTMYPEKFTDIDMSAETKNYYRKFFNLELTDTVIGEILAGKGMRISKGEQG